jgi:cytochrome c553
MFLNFTAFLLSAAALQAADYSFENAQALLRNNCAKCHQGKASVANFNIARYPTAASIASDYQKWATVLARVRSHEMPPKGSPAPAADQREEFVGWLEQTLRTAACSSGAKPKPPPSRRLNRNEYAATLRDLLSIQINAATGLPADGAGGEGFDNAAETLMLSPIHAEKFLDAAKLALDYGVKDPKSRAGFLIATPGPELTADRAAQKVLAAFLPRAFRRPVTEAEIDRYMDLFQRAQKRGDSYQDAVVYALQGVLLSPHFLFRLESGDYAMASRLSYFLWGSMPDSVLFDLARDGKLRNPDTLNEQVVRMLKDPKALEFCERFVEQWLSTRELGRDIKPDPKLFKEYYDAEIQSAIRYEPILFFQEILAGNLSLLNLIDSKFAILTNKSARLYDLKIKDLKQQPLRFDLPENSHRGGLLTMAAVLAVSSYPTRTSPVLRGKWVLESILGTPPPPPPPGVPALQENHEGDAPQTMRERLSRHRADPACASCHNRMDPIGFGLENYDVLGRWRTEEAGKPIDAKGVLPDGSEFNGPDELKTILLKRKDLVIRNLATRMLGYALGRGLTLEDSCAVDRIVDEVAKNGYSSHTLVKEIVMSAPFRAQE